MNSFPILSSIIILPLFGALISMLIKGSEKDVSKNVRDLALWISIVELGLVALLCYQFDLSNSNFQSNSNEYLNHIFKMFPVIGDTQYSEAQKAYGTTSGKMFLWNKAFGLQKSDIYSCLLSEYSVGLGIIGILFCSLIISFLKSISIVLFSLKNEVAYVLGLLIAINMFYFELELYTIFKRIFLSFIITLPLISKNLIPQIVKYEK